MRETVTDQCKRIFDIAAIEAIIEDSHSFNVFRKSGMQRFLSLAVLAHIFRGQVASLMLCDRTKKKMTFAGLEPTPPAIRAVVLSQLD